MRREQWPFRNDNEDDEWVCTQRLTTMNGRNKTRSSRVISKKSRNRVLKAFMPHFFFCLFEENFYDDGMSNLHKMGFRPTINCSMAHTHILFRAAVGTHFSGWIYLATAKTSTLKVVSLYFSIFEWIFISKTCKNVERNNFLILFWEVNWQFFAVLFFLDILCFYSD